MSETLKWSEMSEDQHDAMIAEKIMVWQWIPAGWYGPHVKEGTSWLLPELGLLDIHSDLSAEWTCIGEEKYIPRNWIPRYSMDMSAAWLVVQKMATPFNPKSRYDYEPFILFTDELLGDREEIYPSYDCMAGIAKWTPVRICLAALKSVGVQIEERS